MTNFIIPLKKCNVMIELDDDVLKFGIIDQEVNHIEWYTVNEDKMTIEKRKKADYIHDMTTEDNLLSGKNES